MPERLNAYVALAGRVLLALLFLIEAYEKSVGYAGAVAYAQAFGVPGILLPGAIALELLGGLLVVIGWQTRWAALALAAFCVVTALIFHQNLANINEKLHFLKDLAIAGGFLVLAAGGPGALSVDEREATV